MKINEIGCFRKVRCLSLEVIDFKCFLTDLGAKMSIFVRFLLITFLSYVRFSKALQFLTLLFEIFPKIYNFHT